MRPAEDNRAGVMRIGLGPGERRRESGWETSRGRDLCLIELIARSCVS